MHFGAVLEFQEALNDADGWAVMCEVTAGKEDKEDTWDLSLLGKKGHVLVNHDHMIRKDLY